MAVPTGSRLTPLALLAGLLVVMGAVGLIRDRARVASSDACGAEGDPTCGAVAAGSVRMDVAPVPVLDAGATCRDVGYLCADLDTADRVQVRRWKEFSGTLIVHVPRPDFEDSGDAAELQEAAARGLRAWNGQPFSILTDLRGDREAHFEVRWVRRLTESQIGLAHTQWAPPTGLQVVSIQLSTRNPFNPSLINDARQVQLTAAHEMGHALGLPHSDSERDVMYPSNTASSMSAQDYRTMEALYALEDGTEIVK